MWRPGKGKVPHQLKNPSPIRPATTASQHAHCGAMPVAGFATSLGLRPPAVTHPATLSHPDWRSPRILIVAQQLTVSQITAAPALIWLKLSQSWPVPTRLSSGRRANGRFGYGVGLGRIDPGDPMPARERPESGAPCLLRVAKATVP